MPVLAQVRALALEPDQVPVRALALEPARAQERAAEAEAEAEAAQSLLRNQPHVRPDTVSMSARTESLLVFRTQPA